MDNIMPNITPEVFDNLIEEKAKEMYNLFLDAVNTQITDSVTQVSPEQVKDITKACVKVHLTFFKNPLDAIPKEKLAELNGSALEKLTMVNDYWKGIASHIEKM
jgi:hypothetical protein